MIGCELILQVWEVLSETGIVSEIGKEYLFLFDERHSQIHMQRALKRARQLIFKYSSEVAFSQQGLETEPLSVRIPVQTES